MKKPAKKPVKKSAAPVAPVAPAPVEAPKAPKAAKAPKAPKPPKDAPSRPEKRDEAPTLLSLTNEERLLLRLHESEAVRWASETHLRQAKRAGYLAKIDPERLLAKMDEEIRAVASKSHQARQQYEAVTKKVEERLKVKLANYSFDDETGALVPHN
jgi:hypothetical protein